MAAEEGVDLLWTTRNAFYVGAHQAAIAEAADLDGLGEADRLERDVFVYRAYVELGSYEVSVARLRGGRGRGHGGRGAMIFPAPLPRCARDWARKAARSFPGRPRSHASHPAPHAPLSPCACSRTPGATLLGVEGMP